MREIIINQNNMALFACSIVSKESQSRLHGQMLTGWKSYVVPDFTTSGTLTPRSWAIKPRIEKITNPAKKLVRQLPIVTIIVSLREKTHDFDKLDQCILLTIEYVYLCI